MGYKNIVAMVVLSQVLVFASIWSSAKKDQGVTALELANKYLVATHKQKKVVAQMLDNYLKQSDYSNEQWGAFTDTGNLSIKFQNWSDHSDEKVQEFKQDLYKSYYAKKETEFLCFALKNTVQNFCAVENRQQLQFMQKNYKQDILTLLLLFSKKNPKKKDKVALAMSLLSESTEQYDSNLLYKTVYDLCQKEEDTQDHKKESDQKLLPVDKKQPSKSEQKIITEEVLSIQRQNELREQELRAILSRVLAGRMAQVNQPEVVAAPQQPALPEAQQQAPQAPVAPQPGIFTRLWSGTYNIVSTGVSWIWQGISSFFGGFFSG